MSGRYLSSEELIQYSKISRELPARGGIKDYEPDGSWLQKKKLDNFYNERLKLLSEERIIKCGSLSIGIWRPGQGKVIVTVYKGKFIKSMGQCVDGEWMLHPEEAMFLVDVGALEMRQENRPLSVQEVHNILFESHLTPEMYCTYGHLTRIGFIVRRVEDNLGCLSNSAGVKRKRDDDDDDDDITKTSRVKPNSHFKCGVFEVEDLSKDDIKEESSACGVEESSVWGVEESLNFHEQHDLPLIDVLGIAPDKIIFDLPGSTTYLPGVEMLQSSGLNTEILRKTFQTISRDKFGRAHHEGSTTAKNWVEYKKLQRRDRSFLAKFLWEDEELTPLLDPDRVGRGIEELKVTLRMQMNLTSRWSPNGTKISFNVYPPDSKFKKSNPGRPLYCVAVFSNEKYVRCSREMQCLLEEAHKMGGTLVISTVVDGEVFLCTHDDTPLPCL